MHRKQLPVLHEEIRRLARVQRDARIPPHARQQLLVRDHKESRLARLNALPLPANAQLRSILPLGKLAQRSLPALPVRRHGECGLHLARLRVLEHHFRGQLRLRVGQPQHLHAQRRRLPGQVSRIHRLKPHAHARPQRAFHHSLQQLAPRPGFIIIRFLRRKVQQVQAALAAVRHARHRRGDAPPLRIAHAHRHVQLRVLQILSVLILFRPRQVVMQAPSLLQPVKRAVRHRLLKRRKGLVLHVRPAARVQLSVGHMLLHGPQRAQRRHALRAQHRRAAAHRVGLAQRLCAGQHEHAAVLIVIADHPKRRIVVVHAGQVYRCIRPREIARRQLVHAHRAAFWRLPHILHIPGVQIYHFLIHFCTLCRKKRPGTSPRPFRLSVFISKSPRC